MHYTNSVENVMLIFVKYSLSVMALWRPFHCSPIVLLNELWRYCLILILYVSTLSGVLKSPGS